MKSSLIIGSMALILNACAVGTTRNGSGLLYTETKDSVVATANASVGKEGQACATNILGLVSTGDMSLQAAKKAAGITKVSSVDFSQNSILGVYGKTCTIVHGE